jgi:hypothetical protein
MPQNHDQQEEEDNEREEEDGNKAEKMKTTLLGATPRRTRYSMTPMKSKLLKMKP